MQETLLSSHPARTGVRVVFTETHDDGTVFGPFVEMRPSVDDITAFLATYAAALLQTLQAAEIADRLARIIQDGSLATVPALRFAVLADVRAGLRQAYQFATRSEAIMIGDYLNSLTDTQLRGLFSMTAAQVTNLRTDRLAPAASAATQIRAASGV